MSFAYEMGQTSMGELSVNELLLYRFVPYKDLTFYNVLQSVGVLL